MKPVLFKNVNVIPMDEKKVLENIDLLVEDGNISRISLDFLPGDAEVLQCDGKYLIPGLSDMHMHLNFQGDLDLYLPNGVTTIRNMWGAPEFNKWRDQINAGELTGPTIYNCGQILDGDPPVRPADKYNVTLRTPTEGRREVFRLKKEGYEVTCAEDGQKAIDLLAKKSFDMVISDMQMPNVTGIELLKHVRDRDPDLLFMIITAFGTTIKSLASSLSVPLA